MIIKGAVYSADGSEAVIDTEKCLLPMEEQEEETSILPENADEPPTKRVKFNLF